MNEDNEHHDNTDDRLHAERQGGGKEAAQVRPTEHDSAPRREPPEHAHDIGDAAVEAAGVGVDHAATAVTHPRREAPRKKPGDGLIVDDAWEARQRIMRGETPDRRAAEADDTGPDIG